MSPSNPHWGMNPRPAITAARRAVVLAPLRRGRDGSVFVHGRAVAENLTPDEARVTAIEWQARVALELMGVPGGADLVARALDAGCELRADRLTYAALALAETPPV